MDNVEMAYSKQLYVYNEQVLQGGIKPNLVDMCSEVADKLEDQVI